MGKKSSNRTKSIGSSHYPAFDRQLEIMGMRVVGQLGDGNCLFRSLHHQLLQTPAHSDYAGNHDSLRAELCRFMADNPDEFAPFVLDDEPFACYLKRMQKDGTYGGNLELVAFTRAFEMDLMIYQDDGIVFRIPYNPGGGSSQKKGIGRLVYRQFEHYDALLVTGNTGNGLHNSSAPTKQNIEEWMVTVVARSASVTDQDAHEAIEKFGSVEDAIEHLLSGEMPAVEREKQLLHQPPPKNISAIPARDRKRLGKKRRKQEAATRRALSSKSINNADDIAAVSLALDGVLNI